MKLRLIPLIIIASLTIVATLATAQTYDYLPGDVNMYQGIWPPAIVSSDVTYFINNFKGLADPCYLSNPLAPDPPGLYFWASADINGDCRVAGNDLTMLVLYMRGLATISFCPEYPPSWPTHGDLPPAPPAGWPNCEIAPVEPSDPFEPSPDPEITFWYGNPDGSPIMANINSRLYVDIYMQTADSVYGGYAHIPLGVDNQYIDSLLSVDEGGYFYPFTEWDSRLFTDPFGQPCNPPGWSSQSFAAWAYFDFSQTRPWLHSDIPLKVVTFAAKTVDDPGLIGQTVSCLEVGRHPSNWSLSVSDSAGVRLYDIGATVSQVSFVDDTLYDYIPGDVNMAYGNWPPTVDVSDLAYLINAFRGDPATPLCLIDGIYAAADADGSCSIIGNDVTRFVNYFRGLSIIEYCPDRPPAWPDEESLPPTKPPGWPEYYCSAQPLIPQNDKIGRAHV